MNLITTSYHLFTIRYNQINKIVPFNPAWNNGTGYYNGAVSGEDAPLIPPGEIVKSVSPAPNNRRILIVGTLLGNVVVFERYTDGDKSIIVMNTTRTFSSTNLVRSTGAVSLDDLTIILGDGDLFQPEVNVGTIISQIVRSTKEQTSLLEIA